MFRRRPNRFVPRATLYVSGFLTLLVPTLALPFPGIGKAIAPGEIAGDGGSDGFNSSIAGDGNGEWIAIYETRAEYVGESPEDLPPSGGKVAFVRSRDGGLTWSAPWYVNGGAADEPRTISKVAVGASPDGTWVAAWSAGSSHGKGVWLSRLTRTSQTWSPAQRVATDGHRVVVATDGSGTWLVVFTGAAELEGVTTDSGVAFVRSQDDGRSWSLPQGADQAFADGSGGRGDDAAVATDSAGTWMLSWSTPGKLLVTTSTDDSRTFAAAIVVPSYPGARSSIAHDGRDTWLVAWGRYDLSSIVSRDRGANWIAGPTINANPGTATTHNGLRLRSDRAGRFHVVWESSDGFGGRIGRDIDLVYSHTRRHELQWSHPALVDHGGTEDREIHDVLGQFASDSSDGWGLVWTKLLVPFNPNDSRSEPKHVRVTAAQRRCAEVPRTMCIDASAPGGKSKFVLRSSVGGKRTATWSWRAPLAGVDSTVDDPTASGGYAICAYETGTASELIAEYAAPADTICKKRSCWRQAGRGWRYDDGDRENGPVRGIGIEARPGGRAKVRVRAGGPSLSPPVLPLRPDAGLLVQLISVSGDFCAEAEFDRVLTNTSRSIAAKTH